MAEPMLGEATSEARAWRDRSLAQLTLVRFREFLRESPLLGRALSGALGFRPLTLTGTFRAKVAELSDRICRGAVTADSGDPRQAVLLWPEPPEHRTGRRGWKCGRKRGRWVREHNS